MDYTFLTKQVYVLKQRHFETPEDLTYSISIHILDCYISYLVEDFVCWSFFKFSRLLHLHTTACTYPSFSTLRKKQEEKE